MSLVSVLCSKVEVSATDRSLVQRRPTGCVYVCVCVCVGGGCTRMSVKSYNNNPLHLQ